MWHTEFSKADSEANTWEEFWGSSPDSAKSQDIAIYVSELSKFSSVSIISILRKKSTIEVQVREKILNYPNRYPGMAPVSLAPPKTGRAKAAANLIRNKIITRFLRLTQPQCGLTRLGFYLTLGIYLQAESLELGRCSLHRQIHVLLRSEGDILDSSGL